MKKFCSIILSLVMAIGIFSGLGVVSAAGIAKINLGDTLTLSTSENAVVYFTPSKDGYYQFSSWYAHENQESFDPVCVVRNSNGETVAWDDDSGEDGNFLFNAYLESGEKYKCEIDVRGGGNSVSEFTLTLKEAPMPTYLALNRTKTATLAENKNGVYLEEMLFMSYFYYFIDISDFFNYGDTVTVTYSDGSTKLCTFNGWEFLDEDGNFMDFVVEEDQEYNHWTKGINNYAYITLYDAKAKVRVKIIEDPVDYVEFVPAKPMTVEENKDGYTLGTLVLNKKTNKYEVKEYFYYNFMQKFYTYGNKVIIHGVDGSEDVYTYGLYNIEGEQREVYKNDKKGIIRSFDSSSSQSAETPWKANNTYKVTLTTPDNYDFSFNVKVEQGWNTSKTQAPKLTEIKNTVGGVQLSWNKLPGSTGYLVYRKAPGGSWSKIGSVKASSLTYTDSTAKNNKEYVYTVKAYNTTDGVTTYSKYDNTGKSVTYITAPKPTAAASTTGVTVKWNKISGATGYYVYRKTTGGWTKIATVKNGSTLSYTDKSAKSGTTYTYTVRAYNSKGTSAYYGGSKLLFLATPKLTKATAQSGKITVTFGKVTGAKSYNVYRKTSGGKWAKIGTTTSGSYTDKTAKKGTTYYYTVRAVNGSYMSSYNSSGVSAKAK
ncbi:MAG: fibronectin type III domain-containing protein [Acutalibacteraceae bacterium]